MDDVPIIEKMFKSTRAIYDTICKQIASEWNESKGKEGPWLWTGDDREFKPVSVNYVKQNIEIGCVSTEIYEDDKEIRHVSMTWWFEDGPDEIYGSHSLVVESRDCFTNGKCDLSKVFFQLEG
jgi:hypothetical protein